MRPTSTLAAAVALLGALSSPAGLASAETAVETIARLQAEGYQVNIDKVGKGEIQDCVVTGVRNPNTFTRLVRDDDRLFGSDLVPVIVAQTVNVSLHCG